jgi:tRNA (cytidine/uridine-2'-O-)-methyltransferase
LNDGAGKFAIPPAWQEFFMFHVVLFEPEIPPNTGNIIRLCANAGISLHLIHPLGFLLNDSKLRRAGLDYQEWIRVQEHTNLMAFMENVQPSRVLAYTTKGTRSYHELEYQQGDALLFGPETRGLPASVLETLPQERHLRIPMASQIRSLNLSNAVAIAVYEAWRQLGFKGLS